MISSDFEKNLQPTTVTVQRKPISPECTYSPTNSFATNPTIKEIAEAFRLSHNTTSEHVKKLEKLGYFEKNGIRKINVK